MKAQKFKRLKLCELLTFCGHFGWKGKAVVKELSYRYLHSDKIRHVLLQCQLFCYIKNRIYFPKVNVSSSQSAHHLTWPGVGDIQPMQQWRQAWGCSSMTVQLSSRSNNEGNRLCSCVYCVPFTLLPCALFYVNAMATFVRESGAQTPAVVTMSYRNGHATPYLKAYIEHISLEFK